MTVQEVRLALRTTRTPASARSDCRGWGVDGRQLGPVTVAVDNVGLRLRTAFQDGNAGPFDIELGFKPPNGLGLAIDASVVVGGGYLGFDPRKKSIRGVLQLQIAEKISVKAIGLSTTRMPDGSKGYSLVALHLRRGFQAPIQLGFGFALTGIGGLLAINRTFDRGCCAPG